jgi:hypothetical protein
LATPEVLKEYALRWKKPNLTRTAETLATAVEPVKPEPRGAQIEALYYLEEARDEGASKGVVVAAPVLARPTWQPLIRWGSSECSFLRTDSKSSIRPARYSALCGPESHFGLYTGERKDEGAGVYFATVQNPQPVTSIWMCFPEDYF